MNIVPNTITLELEENADPKIFGKSFWSAYEKITDMIPCPVCKKDAKKLLSFDHDVVNKKTGKPLFDRKNYYNVLNKLSYNNPYVYIPFAILIIIIIFLIIKTKKPNLKLLS